MSQQKLFISHSDRCAADQAFASAIKKVCIKHKDSFEAFIDHDRGDIATGHIWQKKIDEELKKCSHALFIITPEFARSHWLAYEFGAFSNRFVNNDDSSNGQIFPAIVAGVNCSSLFIPVQSRECASIDTEDGLTALAEWLADDVMHIADKGTSIKSALATTTEYIDFCDAHRSMSVHFEVVEGDEAASYRRLLNLREFEILARLDSIKDQNRLSGLINYIIKYDNENEEVLAACLARSAEGGKQAARSILQAARDIRTSSESSCSAWPPRS